jgi:NADH dehydrogenase FAD-containing subunit
MGASRFVSKTKPKIVIVGFGEAGVLTAAHLPKTYEVVAISTKPVLLSGQELGMRVTRPERWKEDFLTDFTRFKGLDGVRILNAKANAVDTAKQEIALTLVDGATRTESYDVLVIATGISNGFWRDDDFRDKAGIEARLDDDAKRMADAKVIAAVGGGPCGAGAAANLAAAYPDKEIHFFFSGDVPLPGYPDVARADVLNILKERKVHLHPNHRAIAPEPTRRRKIDSGAIEFIGGKAPFTADAIIWATGAANPNTGFLPKDFLDDDGYVKVDPLLRVPGAPNVFAIGDVAATDPHRSSARNWAYNIVVGNIAALLAGKPETMKPYKAPAVRWGSIIGPQAGELKVYQPDGKIVKFSPWFVRVLLFPIAVRKMIYDGVRRAR